MIDITPLDIRKKRGDFGRALRGYDPQEVDTFLELAADRLEETVKELKELRSQVADLQERVSRGEGREQAVQEALVMAQELREEIRVHASREANLVRREAEEEVERIRARAAALVEERTNHLEEIDRHRSKVLRELRGFLARELDTVEVEERRSVSVDLSGPAEVRSSSDEVIAEGDEVPGSGGAVEDREEAAFGSGDGGPEEPRDEKVQQ